MTQKGNNKVRQLHKKGKDAYYIGKTLNRKKTNQKRDNIEKRLYKKTVNIKKKHIQKEDYIGKKLYGKGDYIRKGIYGDIIIWEKKKH